MHNSLPMRDDASYNNIANFAYDQAFTRALETIPVLPENPQLDGTVEAARRELTREYHATGIVLQHATSSDGIFERANTERQQLELSLLILDQIASPLGNYIAQEKHTPLVAELLIPGVTPRGHVSQRAVYRFLSDTLIPYWEEMTAKQEEVEQPLFPWAPMYSSRTAETQDFIAAARRLYGRLGDPQHGWGHMVGEIVYQEGIKQLQESVRAVQALSGAVVQVVEAPHNSMSAPVGEAEHATPMPIHAQERLPQAIATAPTFGEIRSAAYDAARQYLRQYNQGDATAKQGIEQQARKLAMYVNLLSRLGYASHLSPAVAAAELYGELRACQSRENQYGPDSPAQQLGLMNFDVHVPFTWTWREETAAMRSLVASLQLGTSILL